MPWSGAADGLVSVAMAAFCLQRQILPADRGPSQFWLRNRADGPRRAEVSATSIGGNDARVILEETSVHEVAAAAAESAVERLQPIVRRGLGLFAIEAHDESGSPNASGSSPRWAASSPESPSTRSLDVGGGGIPMTLISPMDSRSSPMVRNPWGICSNWCREPRQRAAGNASPLGEGSIHFARPDSTQIPRRVAFVYPGLGNYFMGMGRELAALWPEVVRVQDSENRFLRDQFAPEVWWNGTLPPQFVGSATPDHRAGHGRQSGHGHPERAGREARCCDRLQHGRVRGSGRDASLGRSRRDAETAPVLVHCSNRNLPVRAMRRVGPGEFPPMSRWTGLPGSCLGRPMTSVRPSPRRRPIASMS